MTTVNFTQEFTVPYWAKILFTTELVIFFPVTNRFWSHYKVVFPSGRKLSFQHQKEYFMACICIDKK